MAVNEWLRAISMDVAMDCANPITAGLERRAVIINRADIDFANVVYNTSRPNVIEALPLKSGKRGYSVRVDGDTPFTGTAVNMEKKTYRNVYTNTFAFTVLGNDPDLSHEVIDALTNGDFVVVFENKYKNINKETNKGDSTYQIMGLRQGLNAETIANDKYSEDTDGGWAITLTETGVAESALFLYKTDLATTEALFNSLTEAS